ncbi:MAG TPA: DNA-3-methyladenine glycosylase I [Elusimicrobiales bacterium]|nr:DNA-3-methyladenine glycosylase I [Elusimicrobiales bacterium]
MTTKNRCSWAYGASPLYPAYHDEEWGVPVRDDRRQFEFLTLESAQAGLSWATILNKREGYRKAFAGFDPEKVARFSATKIEAILKDPGIVRNRLKVNAAVNNAKRFLEVQNEFGSFSKYIWAFVGNRQKVNRWTSLSQLPATSKESDALSADLKRRGFKFVGSTIVYAHMQATGLVNDHLVNCFRHKACAERALNAAPPAGKSRRSAR